MRLVPGGMRACPSSIPHNARLGALNEGDVHEPSFKNRSTSTPASSMYQPSFSTHVSEKKTYLKRTSWPERLLTSMVSASKVCDRVGQPPE